MGSVLLPAHGQCSSARCCICSESGPLRPYRRMATKAPLFHVRISPGGAQKQGVRLHLMRKGLHTPLVILSTWNPGHSGSEEKRPAGLSVRNGNRKCAGGGSVPVALTNYPCCFQAGIKSGMIHICCARIQRRIKLKRTEKKPMEHCEGYNPVLDF